MFPLSVAVKLQFLFGFLTAIKKRYKVLAKAIKTSKPLNKKVDKFWRNRKHISKRVSLYIPVMDSARAVADSDTGYMAKRRHAGPGGVWVDLH